MGEREERYVQALDFLMYRDYKTDEEKNRKELEFKEEIKAIKKCIETIKKNLQSSD